MKRLLVALVLLLPSHAFAAFGDLVQCATVINTSGTSANIGGAGWGSNVTAANMLAVGVQTLAGRTVTITDGGDTFNQDATQVQTVDGSQGYLQHAFNVAGGAKPTINIAVGASAVIRAVACEFVGSSATATDKTVSAQGNSSTPSSGVTATRTNATELQLGLVANGGNLATTFTAGTGFTIPASNGQVIATNAFVAIEYVTRTITGTDAATFTMNQIDLWACMTATYSNGAGVTTVPLRTLMGVGL